MPRSIRKHSPFRGTYLYYNGLHSPSRSRRTTRAVAPVLDTPAQAGTAASKRALCWGRVVSAWRCVCRTGRGEKR